MNFEKTSSLHRAPGSAAGRELTRGSALAFVHARSGHGAAMEELLLHGLSPNATDADGRTLLMVASAAGHAHIVRSLVESGADVDRRDPMGHSALFAAVAQQNTEIVALLIHLGADPGLPDTEGCSPLMLACDWGYEAVVDVLCRSAANLQQRDRRGRTAHERALLAGHIGCATRIEAAQRRPASQPEVSTAEDLDLPWLVEAPSVSAISVSTGPVLTHAQDSSDDSTNGASSSGPGESGVDMRTPLPGLSLPSEPAQLLRSVTSAYEQLIDSVRRLAPRAAAAGGAAVLSDIENILTVRAQIVEDLCYGYLVRADVPDTSTGVHSNSVLPGATDVVSLHALVSVFDAVAGSVNWAVMILDSHGDDEGAESLRDARRELTRAARAVRKLTEL